MNKIGKTLFGAMATGALAMTAVAPAAAQDRWRDYDRDRGISAGEVIAGAVVLGGLAAILSSATRDRDRYDTRYSRYDDPRLAVERCVRAAETDARRAGYRYADVTQITDVNRTRRGFRVEGRLQVEQAGYASRGNYGRDRWDRNSRYDRYGGGYSDAGRFRCDVDDGRIRSMNYRSIRGLS